MSIVVDLWYSMFSWLTPTTLFILLNLMIATIAISSSFHKTHQTKQDPYQSNLSRSPSLLHRLKSINFHHYTYNHRSQETEHHFYEQKPDAHIEQNLTRAPSILQRLKSINFSTPHVVNSQRHFVEQSPQTQVENHFNGQKQEFHVPKTLSRAPSIVERLKSTTFYNTHFGNSQRHSVEQSFQAHEDLSYDERDEDQFVDYDGKSLDEVYSQLKGCQVNRTKSDTEPSAGEVPAKLSRKMRKSASVKSAFGHFKEEEDIVVEKRRPATVRERTVKVTDGEDHEVDAKADDFINRFKNQLKLQRLDSILRYKEMLTRGKEN